MDTQSNSLQIKLLKKQLSDLIVSKNYDLLDSQILSLSRQLDTLVLPIFKQQLQQIQPFLYILK